MDSRMAQTICLVAAMQFLVLHGVTGSGAWGYYGDDDSDHWASDNPYCSGSKQSPINILKGDVVESSIAAFAYNGFDSTANLALTLKNNGHTAQVDITGGLTVDGGGLSGEYTVAQLHFHWGKSDSKGSEHRVDGHQYPMEMHIVMYKSSYGNISNSMVPKDGLAVLGFFFEIGSTTHPGMQKIVSVLPNIVSVDDTKSVTAFAIDELLPHSHDYFFRYSGSLTTPTCNEIVTWTLFTDTIKVTSAQMAVFRTLQAEEENEDHDHDMFDNFRPTQDVNHRPITANFQASAGLRPSFHFALAIVPVLSITLTRFF